VINSFSKNLTAKSSTKPLTSETFIQFITKKLYLYIERKKGIIISDNNQKFRSIHWPEAISMLGYDTKFTTQYYPEEDCVTERAKHSNFTKNQPSFLAIKEQMVKSTDMVRNQKIENPIKYIITTISYLDLNRSKKKPHTK
jgi:hypothetical protein